MKKVSKAKVIAKAFLLKSDIDEDILKMRRDICAVCPYNSNNVDNVNLTAVERTRKKLNSAPFCTACGCQIDEKTASITEACGLEEKGETPKWNRVKVETSDIKDINLVNGSPTIINIDLSNNGKEFDAKYGDLDINSSTEIILFAESVHPTFEVTDVQVGCASCTKAFWSKDETNDRYKIRAVLDLSKIGKGAFMKSIVIGYKVNNLNQSVKVILRGNLK